MKNKLKLDFEEVMCIHYNKLKFKCLTPWKFKNEIRITDFICESEFKMFDLEKIKKLYTKKILQELDRKIWDFGISFVKLLNNNINVISLESFCEEMTEDNCTNIIDKLLSKCENYNKKDKLILYIKETDFNITKKHFNYKCNNRIAYRGRDITVNIMPSWKNIGFRLLTTEDCITFDIYKNPEFKMTKNIADNKVEIDIFFKYYIGINKSKLIFTI
jgi:hypothetical protein